MVKKHYPHFLEFIKQYGDDKVRECLIKGHTGNVKLTYFKNKKDRWQMLQALDLMIIHKVKFRLQIS